MSNCQHEWGDDQSGDEHPFVCLECGSRLETLTALIRKAEQILGERIDPAPQAAIEGVTRPLSWTMETPTKPGWYWVRNLSGPKLKMVLGIVEAEYYFGSTGLYVSFGSWGADMNDVTGEWAGPLEEPPA